MKKNYEFIELQSINKEGYILHKLIQSMVFGYNFKLNGIVFQ